MLMDGRKKGRTERQDEANSRS